MLFAICCTVLPTKAQKFEPKWVGEVRVLQITSDTVSTATEKAPVTIKTSASAGRLIVGIGNVRQKVTIQGGQSTTQLEPLGDYVYLVVKCKDNESDPTSFIQIVKFEEKKKERRSELAKENWLGSTTEGNMTIIPYEPEQYGKASYLLKMPMQEGEFGVRVLNPNDKDEKLTIFYCFGIHKK